MVEKGPRTRLRVQLVSHEPIGIEKGLDHGGVGISQFTVGSGLAALGHEAEILVPSDREFEELVEGVRIRGWGRSQRKIIGVMLNSRKLLREAGRFSRNAEGARGFTIIPDVAAVPWPYPLPTVKIVKFTCTHLLQRFEANIKRRPRVLTAVAERWRVPRADAFFSISERTAEVSGRVLGLDWHAIPVIPNAVDTNLFRPQRGLRAENGTVLYVGTICEKKGALELVAAIDLLKRHFPNIRLVMIGRNGVDNYGVPDFLGRIRTQFPETAQEHVQVLGHLRNEELVSHYNRATVVALPSRYESFGRTTIEAMACGAPVVRTNAPPAREIIRDEIDGLICRTNDPEDLADKISRLLLHPELRQGLGANARKRACEQYSVAIVSRKTEEFLLRVAHSQDGFGPPAAARVE